MEALFEQLSAALLSPLQREEVAKPPINSTVRAEVAAVDCSPIDATPSRWNDLESPENIARFRNEIERVGSSSHRLRQAAAQKTNNGTAATAQTYSKTLRAAGRKKVWKDSMRLTRHALQLVQDEQVGMVGVPMDAMGSSRGMVPEQSTGNAVRLVAVDLDAAVSGHLLGDLSLAAEELLTSRGDRLHPDVLERKRFRIERIAEVSWWSGWCKDLWPL